MRRRILVLLGFLAFSGSSFRADVPADHAARIERHLVAPDYAKPIPSGRDSIADRMAFWHVPGVSIAVLEGGKVVWAKGFGVADLADGRPVDEHTLFHGASLSKTITAMTVLKLVQDGKLDLDQDINEQLTSWKLAPSEWTKGRKITLRRLMSHTAGMSLSAFGLGYSATQPTQTVVDLLKGKPPATQPVHVEELPGLKFHYSGGAIAIAQLLLEENSGTAYPKLIQRDIFTPLGMTESTFEQSLSPEQLRLAAPGFKAGKRVNGPERIYPAMSAAGLWSTPSDYCKVIAEIQKAIAGKPAKVLSPGAAEAMLTPYIANKKSASPQASTVGLGVFLAGKGGDRTFFHAGSHAGYACYMIGRLETGQGAVVMTNGDDAFDLIGEIVQTIGTEYGWTNYQFLPPPRQKPATQPAT